MKGYKVVSVIKNPYTGDKRYYSAVAHSVCSTEYEIKKPTKPQKRYGPLAVFKTLVDAKNFSDSCVDSPSAIFECKYKKSIFGTLWYLEGNKVYGTTTTVDEPSTSTWSETSNFYFEVKREKYIEFPPGTDFADEVTLIREVSHEEVAND